MSAFAGISARYENKHVGTDRVNLKFEFDSFHDQWNSSTLNALAAGVSKETSDAYARGRVFSRSDHRTGKATDPGGGGEFRTIWKNNIRPRTPRPPTLDCYSALSSAPGGIGQPARPGRKLQLGRGHQNSGQRLRLHVAFREDAYQFTHGKHVLSDSFSAGAIAGRAPLDDRFVMGQQRLPAGLE